MEAVLTRYIWEAITEVRHIRPFQGRGASKPASGSDASTLTPGYPIAGFQPARGVYERS